MSPEQEARWVTEVTARIIAVWKPQIDEILQRLRDLVEERAQIITEKRAAAESLSKLLKTINQASPPDEYPAPPKQH